MIRLHLDKVDNLISSVGEVLWCEYVYLGGHILLLYYWSKVCNSLYLVEMNEVRVIGSPLLLNALGVQGIKGIGIWGSVELYCDDISLRITPDTFLEDDLEYDNTWNDYVAGVLDRLSLLSRIDTCITNTVDPHEELTDLIGMSVELRLEIVTLAEEYVKSKSVS